MEYEILDEEARRICSSDSPYLPKTGDIIRLNQPAHPIGLDGRYEIEKGDYSVLKVIHEIGNHTRSSENDSDGCYTVVYVIINAKGRKLAEQEVSDLELKLQ